MRRTSALPLVASLLWVACSAEPTRIVVVTDTDLVLPSELDEVQMAIDATAIGGAREVRTTVLDGTTVSPPIVLGVVHDGGPLGPITVTVTGLHDGSLVIERAARLSFVAGRSIVLRLDLLGACRAQACTGERSCSSGVCVPLDVDGGPLPSWDGRDALGTRSDAGASMDASRPLDAGPIDPGRDAGLTCHDGCACAQACIDDVGCSCLAGCRCVLACVPGSPCTHVVCDGSGTECLIDGGGTTAIEARCDHDARCTMDARGSENATALNCRNGSTCDADCRGASDCHLKCESEASCLLTCDPGSDACVLECSGESADCGDGVFACNRSCP